MLRTGSASSTTSSERGGSLGRPKPPTKPKPAKLKSPSSTLPSQRQQPPPPKPARSVSHKVRGTTPPSTTATPTRGGGVATQNGDVTSPDHHTAPPLTNGSTADGKLSPRASPRPQRSSAPGGGAAPPPKPLRVGTRQPHSKSESETGSDGSQEKSPLSPISTNTAGGSRTPPPKPARRGKSTKTVKIVDPLEEGGGGGGGEQQELTSKTLPHHFKIAPQEQQSEQRGELTSPQATSPARSTSPKPVPKPRVSLGTVRPIKPSRSEPRTDRKELTTN